MGRRTVQRPSSSGAVVGVALVLMLSSVLLQPIADAVPSEVGESAVIARIPLPYFEPNGPFLDAENGNLYITTEGGDSNGTMYEISGATNEIVGNVTVGWEPAPPTVALDTGELFVPNFSPGVGGGWGPSPNVTVVSGQTDSAIASISTGAEPSPAVYDADTGLLYVPAYDSALGGQGWDVNVISSLTDRIAFNLTLGVGVPATGFFDPANGDLYFLDLGGISASDRLTVVSGTNNTLLATISLPGSCSFEFLFDLWTGNFYLPCSGGVAVISSVANTIVDTVPIAGAASAFVEPEGDVGFLQPGVQANVSIVSGSSGSILRSFPVGGAAAGTYVPATGDLYTVSGSANRSSDILNVTSLSTGARIQSLVLDSPGVPPTEGAFFDAPVYDPENGLLYVAADSLGPQALYVIAPNATSSMSSPNSSLPLIEGLVAGFAVGVALVGSVVVLLRRSRRR